MPVLYCDIDGTVADIQHRRHLSGKDWDAFFDAAPDDLPIPHIIRTVQQFKSLGWAVIFITGRSDRIRGPTKDWLAKHKVTFDGLYMRSKDDRRTDDIVKDGLFRQAVFDGWEPDLVLEDRQRVVDMWRAYKVPTIQVAPGDF